MPGQKAGHHLPCVWGPQWGKQKPQLCLLFHNQAVGFSEKGLWAATELGKGMLNLVA